MSWFETCYRQGFQNLGGKGLTRFDARALARSWKERGAELVYMNAIHGGEVLYPSALAEMAPDLHGRDLVGELTDECRRLGLRSGAYISPLEHHPFTQAHPDWRQTRTDGTVYGDGRKPPLYWACWNTEYLDRFGELVSELFTRYPLDAVFFDGLVARQGVCHCPSCTAKFTADTGFALPGAHDLEDPAFRAYLRWKDLSMAAACRRLVAATRVVNPEVQAVSNTPAAWCNWCATQPVELFDASEFVCVEVFPGFGDTLTAPGTLHYSAVACMAYNTAYTRGQAKGFPKVQAYSYTGEMNFSIDHDIMLEARATVAQGGLSCVQGYRPALKEAFDYIRRCEPYLVETKPVLWSALVASQESCNTQFVNDAVSGAYFEDIRGTFGALLESRLPVEFVSGRDLVESPLDPYAVLILSDVGYLTPAQAEAVRRFVRAGGGLVATAQTGLIGENGKPLADFALADVLGVQAVPPPGWQGTAGYRQEAVQACLAFEGDPWWGDAVQPASIPEAGPLHVVDQPWIGTNRAHPVPSPFQAVAAAVGCQVHAWMCPLAGGASGRLPGIVESRYGKGRVIYFAPRLGEIYARYPFPLWRRLLETAARRVAARPPDVEVRAPLCVTAYSWEQSTTGGWIIHLINELDETGRPRGRMPEGKNPLYGSLPRGGTVPVDHVEILVRKPGATRAELPLEGRALTVVPEDGALRILLGRLEQHSLVVVS
jgi:hypothetical protein